MPKSVWCVDIDITIACSKHRLPLLVQYCSMCGKADGGLKTVDMKTFKSTPICLGCDGDVFHTPPSSWQRFTQPELMANDTPNKDAQLVIRQAIKFGTDIHYITGRQEIARSVTMQWLQKNFDFNPLKNKLLMREVDGFSDPTLHVPASKHKESAFKNLKEWCGYSGDESFYFFEDDEYARKMYAKYGIVMTAPACWATMVPPSPTNAEPLFHK